ncbi:hypothetical protein GCM10025792_25050 [Pseudonocardia tropica]
MSAATALSPAWGDVAVSDKAMAPVLASTKVGLPVVDPDARPVVAATPVAATSAGVVVRPGSPGGAVAAPTRDTLLLTPAACGFAPPGDRRPGPPGAVYPAGPRRMPPVSIDAL